MLIKMSGLSYKLILARKIMKEYLMYQEKCYFIMKYPCVC